VGGGGGEGVEEGSAWGQGERWGRAEEEASGEGEGEGGGGMGQVEGWKAGAYGRKGQVAGAEG